MPLTPQGMNADLNAGLNAGRYRARMAVSQSDLRASQALRQAAFAGADQAGLDSDRFDDICSHMLVEDARTGEVVCSFRMLALSSGTLIDQSYSAQFYNLTALKGFTGKMVEMGRFCVRPGVSDPDVLRVAWGAMTRYVDDNAIEMLFGCSSFEGTDAGQYPDAFALLKERHLAPSKWAPKIRAPLVVRYMQDVPQHLNDPKQAMQQMPPLLRTYLVMGGWVSDHAVVDRQMNTLHVFTGLEINAIPPARKRLLRAMALMLDGEGVAR